MASPPLTTPVDLWRKLQAEAGLELRRNSRPGRDADVEAAVRKLLPLPTTRLSLERWLAMDAKAAQPKISIEQFLIAVLHSQREYARLMQDIFATLALAAARQSDHALDIEFRFDDVNDPIRMTLDQFRAHIERTESVLQSRFELPEQRELWSIDSEMRRIDPSLSNVIKRCNDFPAVMPAQKSGNASLDEILSKILQLIGEYRHWCLGFGSDRKSAVEAVRNSDKRDELWPHMGAAHDFVDTTMEELVHQLAAGCRKGKISAAKAVTCLQPVVSRLRTRQEWVEQTVEDALDLLNLPAWKRRHELYSVWAGTRLLATIAGVADKTQFHVLNGALSFAFGGSLLATYHWNGGEYRVLAERRSELVGVSPKRKKGIQPDFRVVRVAPGLSDNDATCLVLECKHYLTPRKSDFANAASDYARSCSVATVIVVNHGAADEAALLDAVEAGVRSRVRFLGNIIPAPEAVNSKLDPIFRRALFPPSATPIDPTASVPHASSPIPNANVAVIELRWTGELQDMDLIVELNGRQANSGNMICFSTKGDLTAPPFIRLREDVQRGPGAEYVDIGKWHCPLYKIIAHNYSGTGRMTPDSLTCKVTVGGAWFLLGCPPLANDEVEWEVGLLEVENDIAVFKPGKHSYLVK
jgi:hypothetical protein